MTRESLASAMLNSGETEFRTSVSGEPRGPVCGMGICYECRVTVDGVAHRRSCLAESKESEGGGASAAPIIRQCDVLVVGAGPAGIAAATCAAEAGVRVIVADEGFGPGGQIWRPSVWSAHGGKAKKWIARLEATRAERMRRTSIIDVRGDQTQGFEALGESGDAAVRITAKSVVLATGARERFLPFPGWTLPNVVGVGGAQALLKAGTNFRGKRVVIAGSGPLLMPVASAMAGAGAKLLIVAEQAPMGRVMRYATSLWKKPATLMQAAVLRSGFLRTSYSMGMWIESASGDDKVRSVTLTDGKKRRTFECDFVCAAFGLVPNLEIARLAGCKTERGVVVVDGNQTTTIPGLYCAGEPTGIAGVDASVVEGEIAGLAAAGRRVDANLVARRRQLHADAAALDEGFALRPELSTLATPDTIICRCEDVRLRDLDRNWSRRQAKLYTRAGMGPCQGRVCGAALESIMGWQADSVRPPTQPARVATFVDAAAPSNVHGA